MDIINKILYKEIIKQIWKLLFILCLAFLAVGLEAVIPWSYKLLIDNVLGQEPVDAPGILARILKYFQTPQALGVFVVLLFFVSNLLIGVIDYIRHNLTKKVITRVIYDFSISAFRNLESYSIGFFKGKEIGDYIYRLNYDVSAIGSLLEHAILPVVTSSLYILIATVIMFVISPKLSLISFLTVPFLAAIVFIFNKKIGRVTKHSETLNSTVFSFVQQTLTQLKVIQAYSQEQHMAEKFDRTLDQSLQTELQLNKVIFLLDLLIGIVIAVIYTTIFGYGINAVFSGEITTGLLIVFIFYLDNLTNPIIAIADAVSDFKESYVQVNRMSEFFKETSHINDSGKLTQIQDASIRFENITVNGKEEYPILDNISCTIPQGGIMIIAGLSGSGKSSLISLIMRLIENPSKGTMYLGNQKITDYSLKTLRENIAYVPQESTLFNDTIRNIIAFGKPDASFEEIEKAAKLACADEFIRKHPKGYDFRVGEEGNYLSGGQRQRLMLARAFLKNSKILIFDEPFSSLDEVTKHKVWDNIQEGSKGKTTIIVSNVLDVITTADSLIILNKGKITYSGKFTLLQITLLQKRDELAKLILERG